MGQRNAQCGSQAISKHSASSNGSIQGRRKPWRIAPLEQIEAHCSHAVNWEPIVIAISRDPSRDPARDIHQDAAILDA
jgi:hypothetical protein